MDTNNVLISWWELNMWCKVLLGTQDRMGRIQPALLVTVSLLHTCIRTGKRNTGCHHGMHRAGERGRCVTGIGIARAVLWGASSVSSSERPHDSDAYSHHQTFCVPRNPNKGFRDRTQGTISTLLFWSKEDKKKKKKYLSSQFVLALDFHSPTGIWT